MKPQFIIVLRWIGVLPTAVACYFAAYAIIKLLNYLSMFLQGGGWLQTIMIPALSGAGASYYAIHFGSMMAPKYKSIVAVVLSIILSSVLGISIIMLVRNFRWMALVEIVGAILGMILGVAQIFEDEKKQSVAID